MRILSTLLLSSLVIFPALAVDMEDVAARVNRMEHRMSTLEKKMFNGNTPSADGSTAFADFQIRLEELEKENTTLYGSVEQLGRAVEELAKQVKTMNEDTALRLQDLEKAVETGVKKPVDAAAAAPKKAAPEYTPAPAIEKSTAQDIPQDLEPEELYRTAYKALTNADYDKAKHWFKTLTEREKRGESVENAYHWLGEIHMVENNPTEAIIALKDGMTKFPKSAKVPSYLQKMGEAFVALNKSGHAKSVWEKLLKDYPSSPEAAQVKPKLDALNADKE